MKKQIIKLIEQHDSITLFTHTTTDGDSVASSYGLALALKQKYPKKDIKVCTDYQYLVDHFKFLDFNKEMFTTENKASLAIVGDTSVSSRIWFYEEFQKSKNKIVFDHHQDSPDVEYDLFWHEPNYPASALQAFEIAEELGIKYSKETAKALLTGILTDTGFFKFSGANPFPPKAFAKLLEVLDDKDMNDYYNQMFVRTKEDMELTAQILSKVQYDGQVAYCVFEKEFVEKYSYESIKFKVNTIGHIEGTKIWTFITSNLDQEGAYKVSLRSKGPNIREVAKKFQGGGHIKAAGAKLDSIKELPKLLLELNNAK